MTIKDLLQLLPDRVRVALYAGYAVAVFVAGGLAVAGVDTGATPDVLAYVGGALGVTAAANVRRRQAP